MWLTTFDNVMLVNNNNITREREREREKKRRERTSCVHAKIVSVFKLPLSLVRA